MRNIACILTLSLAALSAAPAAHAARQAQPLPGCVDLSPAHQAFAFGSQYLLIKDGEQHYRLGLESSCGNALRSSEIRISADRQNNRLCPQQTRISSRKGSCGATGVELIEAKDYERYQRTRR